MELERHLPRARPALDGDSRRGHLQAPRGERPLWDFPDGLYRREVAAYELSEALGWDVVPLTVLRDGPPLGDRLAAAVRRRRFRAALLHPARGRGAPPALRAHVPCSTSSPTTPIARAATVLVDADGHVWGIDNGLSFHAEFKLRTVIWDFAGEPVPADLLADLDRLVHEGLPDPVASLLDPFERDAVLTRARAVIREGELPIDETGRRYPWPLV